MYIMRTWPSPGACKAVQLAYHVKLAETDVKMVADSDVQTG